MTTHLFRQQIRRYAAGDYDELGKIEYPDEYTVFYGRLQDLSFKEKQDAKRDNIQADVTIYAPNTESFVITDRLYYAGTYYEVVDIYNTRDGVGNVKFIKLLCKRVDNV